MPMGIIRLAYVEDMVSETVWFVGGDHVSTDTVVVLLVFLLDIESVEIMGIVSMYGACLSEVAKYLRFVLQLQEHTVWFRSWGIESYFAECSGVQVVFDILCPFFKDLLGASFSVVRQGVRYDVLFATASLACQLVCSFVDFDPIVTWDPL